MTDIDAMMGHRMKLKNGDEVDAICARRVVKNTNPSAIKKILNKRLRKEAKQTICHDHNEWFLSASADQNMVGTLP